MAVAAKSWTVAYGRYVRFRVIAQEVEVDVPNNRSKVRVTSQIYYEGGTRATNAYPQTYTITVNGTQIGRQTGITYNLASGATMNLTTYTSGWIAHNSNGAKSVTVRGHITDSAGDTATISQSYALTTIARASTLNSFSMPNHLKPDTTTTFNLGITSRSSSFRHDIQLRDGSTVIASWTGQTTPSTRSLTATQTNTLLKRMSSSTSRTMTLRVQTKSGSTNIGGALTRTATVYVSSTVKPSVSALSVTIEGNTHAKNNVKRFVQNISRVSGKFTRNAIGGASITSSKLEIRRKSGGADHQSINSNSGTFPRVLALNDQYQAMGTATDSRGRSNNTGWVDLSNFNVLAYSVPQITNFSTDRRVGTETTVDIARYGTHSGLSGSNVLTITLQKRASGATSWTNVVPNTTATANTFGATVPSTGNSVALSYDFRLYIVDQFGNSAEQILTVPTQKVVLDIHKNEGVGIGKIHERGELDVAGEVFLDGYNIFEPLTSPNLLRNSSFENGTENWVSETGGTFKVDNKILKVSTPVVGRRFYYNTVPKSLGTQATATFYSRVTSGTHKLEVVQGSSRNYILGEVELNTEWQRHSVTFNYAIEWTLSFALMSANVEYQFRNIKLELGGRATPWTPKEIALDGEGNDNGRFIKYADGTLICWSHDMTVSQITTDTMRGEWTYPHRFVDEPAVFASMDGNWHGDAGPLLKGNLAIRNRSDSNFGAAQLNLRTGAGTIKSGMNWTVSALAIGRWG